MSACKGTTKAGNPCKSKPLTGSDYCRQHQVVERVKAVEEPEVLIFDDICGHQNLHYTEEEPMLCDLENDHEGDHSAEFYAVDYKDGGIAFEGMRRTYWSDAAGTPVDQIEPDYDALAKIQIERAIRNQAQKLAAQA